MLKRFVVAAAAVLGSWRATEQETGVSQLLPSQNSYCLRETGEYDEMDTHSFAKVTCKSRNFRGNFCNAQSATY